MLKLSSPKQPRATVFILNRGRDFFESSGMHMGDDNVNGWTNEFEETIRFDAIGDHFEFFKIEENIVHLAHHLNDAISQLSKV